MKLKNVLFKKSYRKMTNRNQKYFSKTKYSPLRPPPNFPSSPLTEAPRALRRLRNCL